MFASDISSFFFVFVTILSNNEILTWQLQNSICIIYHYLCLFHRQLYSYGRGSRSYAKRLVIVLTDGLLVGKSDLITEANNLKSFANVLTVALGKSVKHDLLEKIASNTESILQPSSSKIWRFLQAKYANPACLCKSLIILLFVWGEWLENYKSKVRVVVGSNQGYKSGPFADTLLRG